MANNQLTVSGRGKKQFTEIQDILKNPLSRGKLQALIDECVRCKTKILDENESIKGLRDSAVEELGIQPKMFSALVSLFFNNNFDEKLAEIGELETAIDGLMQTGPALTKVTHDDEE